MTSLRRDRQCRRRMSVHCLKKTNMTRSPGLPRQAQVNLGKYLYVKYELDCDGKILMAGDVVFTEEIPPHALHDSIPQADMAYQVHYQYISVYLQ